MSRAGAGDTAPSAVGIMSLLPRTLGNPPENYMPESIGVKFALARVMRSRAAPGLRGRASPPAGRRVVYRLYTNGSGPD
jgi:hypothetical protein